MVISWYSTWKEYSQRDVITLQLALMMVMMITMIRIRLFIIYLYVYISNVLTGLFITSHNPHKTFVYLRLTPSLSFALFCITEGWCKLSWQLSFCGFTLRLEGAKMGKPRYPPVHCNLISLQQHGSLLQFHHNTGWPLGDHGLWTAIPLQQTVPFKLELMDASYYCQCLSCSVISFGFLVLPSPE